MSQQLQSLNAESALEKALDVHLSGTPERLASSIRYSVMGPGKRVRPRLLLACAKMISLNPEAAMAAAVAIELIHCYTLIHDDLPCMDNDDFRRGRPSNHKQFDEATALLAGDSLIPLAFESLLSAKAHVSSENVLAAIRRLAWAAGPRGVVAGQAEELELKPDSTIDKLKDMHAKKTGALFSASLLMPIDLAGISEKSNEGRVIVQFAGELGLAFQVADDIEDSKQDTAEEISGPGSGATVSPRNILYYLPRNDARLLTLDSLSRAKKQLLSLWDTRAIPLVSIADEVASKLAVDSL